ncbi:MULTISPECIES: GspE/PulE family protein [Peptoniphilus]|uniref:GspE/PulE family protein n=1 Tax=Peptoniphilus TaxID=162289 RepID=UPI0008DAE70B|nr:MULTISPECIES: GspE/PulE family protein [Peptoniphilus]MBS6610606.1 type II/IV secretion system protein [Peptoniphilus harei]MDU1954646.1 GspE/PulE family protein [Peptoniphilus lacydonensis]MDU2115794.1 GspE/PulE family protein [Peptoniphilus lacydonensis]MDU3750751.1 GspE/PulE family protein [Peptoniphilus rhinitidis]MDU5275207.1 GspE/PulE family protein [Peptoniphilus lacydonensis]
MNKFSFEIKDKFGENYCRKNFIAPAREEDDCFVFYSLHNDELLKYNLEQKLQKKVLFEIKSEEKVIDEIDKIYRDEEKYNILRDINLRYKDDITLKENEKEDSPAVRVLDYIIRQSIIRNASDIHIEPRFQDIVVRIRIDGALNELMRLPKNIYPHLVTRIKILSKLDISEKRLPQDGRFSFKFKNEDIDIRVATTPTGTGEKIVLRILDVQRISYTPEGIGLSGENLDKVMNLISQPSGLILCCGPTSSGKTSSLYTILRKIQKDDINIMTIEDPIEYKIDGINQIEVNPNTGLTFEKGLKAILRMDPDKVMIGEIRNEDTAHIAISSSITGHLVLSTLHTESSPASIGRLIDMGIEPYLISAGLIGVISQRLIRKLCPHCKEKIKNTNPLVNSKYVYRASGCEKCNSGYSGRIAVFEIMIVDSEIRQMITNRESVAKIKEVSIKKGMNTLSHEILNLIENGETTFEEFYKNVHTVGEL